MSCENNIAVDVDGIVFLGVTAISIVTWSCGNGGLVRASATASQFDRVGAYGKKWERSVGSDGRKSRARCTVHIPTVQNSTQTHKAQAREGGTW